MQIGHWLHQAGIEFSQSDISPKGSFTFSFADAPPLHEAEFELSVVGEIAKEIAAGRFAFDEEDLRKLAGNREVILIGPENAGPDRIDDAERRKTNFGGDATIAHAQQPAAGFL